MSVCGPSYLWKPLPIQKGRNIPPFLDGKVPVDEFSLTSHVYIKLYKYN